jgi:hypothetical protein
MSKRIPAATAAMHEIRLCHLGMPLRSADALGGKTDVTQTSANVRS